MEVITINAVENMQALLGADQPVWFVHRTLPDGSSNIIKIVHEALSWRIAEYGINPADIDTVLDIILHEPFLAEHTPDTHPYIVDEKTAREWHLARIAESKAKIQHQDPNGYLDKIRQAHDPNSPLHAARARKVIAARALHKGR